MATKTIAYEDGEKFDITITGNAPFYIEKNIEHIVEEWINKQGSSVYFTGIGPGIKGKKVKKLILKLKVTRRKD